MIELANQGTINKNIVTIGNIDLYFSYKTIVAFRDETGFYCSVNVWSKTTNKFLNEISTKEQRISNEEFNTKLQECLKRHNLE